MRSRLIGVICVLCLVGLVTLGVIRTLRAAASKPERQVTVEWSMYGSLLQGFATNTGSAPLPQLRLFLTQATFVNRNGFSVPSEDQRLYGSWGGRANTFDDTSRINLDRGRPAQWILFYGVRMLGSAFPPPVQAVAADGQPVEIVNVIDPRYDPSSR